MENILEKIFNHAHGNGLIRIFFVCRERSLSLDKQKLISREVINHVNKGVLVDQFYAERLYSKTGISDLLEKVGFSDIILHGSISPESQRDQDLGMMEKRIIVSAIVKKEWTEIKKKEKISNRNSAVIFGDPNKPDILKPLNKFDDDDFFTINQLKTALKDLKEYSFSFFDNHNTLIQDLLSSRGKVDFVFNLCDEGYYNDARKELHIPALLEILRIPYTGSGPQCLAFCYDKSLVRGIAKELEIPVPEGIIIKPGEKNNRFTFIFPCNCKTKFWGLKFWNYSEKCSSKWRGIIKCNFRDS
jgi:D-alanine-D-alanine ligase